LKKLLTWNYMCIKRFNWTPSSQSESRIQTDHGILYIILYPGFSKGLSTKHIIIFRGKVALQGHTTISADSILKF